MTIFGWDASHYDNPPDAARLVREGFSFFTHKAGGDGDDPELAATWDKIKNVRSQVLTGAYWVVRPDLHSNPAADADAFLARLDSQCPGWRDGPFILQADCESWGDSSGKKKPNKAHIKAFCDRLKAKAPKLMPVVYASAGDYGDALTGLGYPLWNARYVLSDQTGTASGLYARCGGDSGKGWARYSGQDPAIWQFTSSATIVGQTTCDANAFKGSLAQLTALVAPGWAENMDLTPQNLKDIAQSVASKLYVDLITPASGLAHAQATSESRIVQAVTADVDKTAAAIMAAVGKIGSATVSQDQLNTAVYAALKQLAAGA